MNNKILPNSPNTIFEPHIHANRKLPFIHHISFTTGRRVSNFHENLELLFFIEGNGYVEYNAQRYEVTANDLIVVNSFAIHQVVSETPIKYFCLIVENSFCKYNDIDISAIHFQEHINDSDFTELFHRLVKEFTTEQAYKSTAIKSLILSILLNLCRNYSSHEAVKPSIRKSSQECICSAIQYIKNNIGNKMTVEEVAASVGLSQYYFMREFKHYTGCTLTNYIKILRCEYAKELLMSRKYKIKEISALCGFENESYFTSVFKSHTGVCPSEYAKSTCI